MKEFTFIFFAVACALMSVNAQATEKKSCDYVKDGLVAHWDGIDNTLKNGVRSHDAKATTWCDLSGNGNDFAIPAFVKIESNAMLSCADKQGIVNSATAKTLKGLSADASAPSFTVEVVAQRVRWTNASNPWSLQPIFLTPRGSVGYRGGKNDCFYVLYPKSATELVVKNVNEEVGKRRGEMAETYTASVTFANGSAHSHVYLDDGIDLQLDTRNGDWSCKWFNEFQLFANTATDIRIFAVRVYNRELTAEERAQNAKLDAARFTTADTPSERAIPKVNVTNVIGKIRRELHSAGYAPVNYNCPEVHINDIKSMNLHATRTHDWALIDPAQRVIDYFHIFPLMHLDAKDPKNYYFDATDNIIKRAREETGLNIFYRLGTSIEHTGKVHFNTTIPEDFDKVAEVFAGIVRHYNKGWANGHHWDIKYWEIWNEPDGRNMWEPKNGTTMTQEERHQLFIQLFVKVLKRLKSEFPDIKVGGPATCYGMHEKYFRPIFEACKKEGVAPDFISWHTYSCDADSIMNCAKAGRKLCDSYGFTKCELINNEWHYLGKYGWQQIASKDPELTRRVYTDPYGHNGIDSAVFVLETLSKFQTSLHDQAYYYGHNFSGIWGYKNGFNEKYKVYYALKMFGDIVTKYTKILESKSDTARVTPFAGLSENGKEGFVLIADYGGRGPMVVELDGVKKLSGLTAVMLDHTNDMVEVPVKYENGRLELPRNDRYATAYLVKFVLP